MGFAMSLTHELVVMIKRVTQKLAARTSGGLAYEVCGEGFPVLTVHGGPGTDHRLFRPYLDPLASNHKLIYFDLPGHGESSPVGDYSLSTMAHALGEVLEAAGERQACLLGSSYGGFLSLTFALTYPQKVSGLILVGTSASHQFRQESLDVAWQKGTPDMLAALEHLWSGNLTSDTDFCRAWREILPLYFYNFPVDEIRQLANRSTYNINSRRKILPTLYSYDLRTQLGEIQAPSLVLVGEHDWITGLGQAEGLVNKLVKSQLVVFYESGHYPFIEENSKFISVVGGWLSAVSGREKGEHDASSEP